MTLESKPSIPIPIIDITESGGFDADTHWQLRDFAQRQVGRLPKGHPMRQIYENTLRLVKERLEREGLLF